jgi:hypothetical protein
VKAAPQLLLLLSAALLESALVNPTLQRDCAMRRVAAIAAAALFWRVQGGMIEGFRQGDAVYLSATTNCR